MCDSRIFTGYMLEENLYMSQEKPEGQPQQVCMFLNSADSSTTYQLGKSNNFLNTLCYESEFQNKRYRVVEAETSKHL